MSRVLPVTSGYLSPVIQRAVRGGLYRFAAPSPQDEKQKSRSVETGNGHLRIVAALTIKGVTREVPFDVQFTIASDTLRATATFAVKQTDFGIRPYRGGPGGTVRVADKVTFDVSAVAVRQ